MFGISHGVYAATQDGFFALDPSVKTGSGLNAPGGVTLPVSKNEYANLFFKNCTGVDPRQADDPYTQSTCACAAAALPDILTLGQMAAVFKSDPDDIDIDLYTRFMYLGYMPCMTQTMRDFVFDSCLEDPSINRLIYRKAVCNCMAKGVSGFFEKNGFYLIPEIQNYSGMMRLDPQKTPADLMGYLLFSDQGKTQTNLYSEKCVASEAFAR